MSKVYTGIDSSEIYRGYLYWAAIPFTRSLPLEIVEDVKPKDDQDSVYKIIKDLDGFNFDKIGDNDFTFELKVVVPHKIRIALVLQNDFYNHNPDYHQVFVAPIQTLHRENKSKSFIKKLTIENELPNAHYLGIETGHEAFVNLGDIKRIHKSLILKPFREKEIDNEIMNELCKKLSILLDIKEIAACDECKFKCENCALKNMAVNK